MVVEDEVAAKLGVVVAAPNAGVVVDDGVAEPNAGVLSVVLLPKACPNEKDGLAGSAGAAGAPNENAGALNGSGSAGFGAGAGVVAAAPNENVVADSLFAGV